MVPDALFFCFWDTVQTLTSLREREPLCAQFVEHHIDSAYAFIKRLGTQYPEVRNYTTTRIKGDVERLGSQTTCDGWAEEAWRERNEVLESWRKKKLMLDIKKQNAGIIECINIWMEVTLENVGAGPQNCASGIDSAPHLQ